MGQVLDKGNNYYLLYWNSANGMTNLRHIFSIIRGVITYHCEQFATERIC